MEEPRDADSTVEAFAGAAIVNASQAMGLGPAARVISHLAFLGKAEPVQHAIQKMGSGADKDATAHRGPIEVETGGCPPAADRTFLEMKAADAPEVSSVEQLLQQHDRVAKSGRITDRDRHIVFALQIADFFAVGGTRCQRLLNEAMQTTTGASGGDRFVGVIRRGDDDAVYCRMDVIDRASDFYIQTVTPREPAGAIASRIDNRDDLHKIGGQSRR